MARPKSAGLTSKQATILTELETGKHPTEIANKQGVTPNAIFQHMRRIKQAGYTLPLSEPKRRGRPPGSGKGKGTALPQLTLLEAKAGVGASGYKEVAIGSPASADSLAKAIEAEILASGARSKEVEKQLTLLLDEKVTLLSRIKKLVAAHKALTA